MNKPNFTVLHLFFVLIAIAGCMMFLSFCWPAVCKGMVNVGNICGMAGSVVLVIYGLCYKQVHVLARSLWQKTAGRILLIVLLLLLAVAVVLLAAAALAIFRAASSGQIPKDTPAVVLGCSVKGNRPSKILQERIDAAYEYLQEHPQAICILSGGKGHDEDISEAECMYRELVRAGIDAKRLYREAGSTNTQENLENSKKILESLDMSDDVAIISSEFHLYRARQWARALGYEDYGYPAHTDWKYRPMYFLREMIAVVYLWLF